MTVEVLRRGFSRREFLKSTAAFAVAQSALGQAQALASQRVLAYVGTYTNEGGENHGEGIYLFEMNPHTGELSHRTLAAKTPNPSWIAIHPSKKYLYTVNEVSDFEGSSGSVSAFVIDAATGALTALNTISSEGAGPAHMSVDSEGRFAFVANYGGGTIAVLSILPDGSLGSAVDTHRDTGFVGATRATDGPPGSFSFEGHSTPHCHMIAADPKNRFVLATDLGQDRIYIYRFDAATGKLTPSAAMPFASLPAGDGPRHFRFHPNGRWFYSLQEESSTLTFFHYDAERGSLAAQQTISALPEGFTGSTTGSEIQIAHDGRFLYMANRLYDTISVCAIGGDGRLKLIANTPTMSDYPRYCGFAPGGEFLYSCNERSDTITSFRVDRETGLLTFTGQYAPVGNPTVMAFLV